MLADLIMLGYYCGTTLVPIVLVLAIYHHLPRYPRR